MALLLAESIASLFVMILAGFLLVRCKVLKEEDSRPLSMLVVYVLCPCAMVAAFDVDCTPEVARGLVLAFVAAVVAQVLPIVIVRLLAKPLRLTSVGRASAVYSNCANLIIPLIVSTLGPQWVVYSLAYVAVSVTLMFTHGESLISGRPCYGLRNIVTNTSLIGILIGFILFVTGLRLPGFVSVAVNSLGSMLGPVSMVVAGISIGAADLRQIASSKSMWLAVALRLVVLPLMMCLMLKCVDMTWLVADARSIFLVTLLAASAPSASLVVQLAVIHDNQPAQASAINVMSTLCCIVTMPLMVLLYQL